MKARIPLTKQQYREMTRCADEYLEQERKRVTRRFFKLFICALNEMYGFGVTRLLRLVNRVNELSTEGEANPVFWKEIDHTVIDYLGIPFDYEKTNIDGDLTE